MMTVFAMIFPMALALALGTIAMMIMTHGGKMMAALRMEPYPAREASPRPPSGESLASSRIYAVRPDSGSAVSKPALLAV